MISEYLIVISNFNHSNTFDSFDIHMYKRVERNSLIKFFSSWQFDNGCRLPCLHSPMTDVELSIGTGNAGLIVTIQSTTFLCNLWTILNNLDSNISDP